MAADIQEVVNKIKEKLETLPDRSFNRNTEIHYRDDPFIGTPVRGLILSPLKEIEGDSHNDTQDIGFPVVVIRAGFNLRRNYVDVRDTWRQEVFAAFNRTRIGVSGLELITRCNYREVKIPEEFQKHHYDASALVITTWIRRSHN